MATDWEEDCMEWHGRILDGPRAHWCADWDDLPIDDTLPEARLCSCYVRTGEEFEAIPKVEEVEGSF